MPTLTQFELSQRHRLAFRNERSLYRRKCDATGEEIISIYSQDKPYKIYKSDYWYGDKWDALDFGRDFDFNRPFFKQFAELQLQVPRLALSNAKGVNSEYCNMTFYNKNCYLIFGGDFNEDSAYGILCMHNKNVMECDYSNNCELCYEISDCLECYNVDYATDCRNCFDCSYISDCIGCNNCILCTNLINQSYCIENKKLSKEGFKEKKKQIFTPPNSIEINPKEISTKPNSAKPNSYTPTSPESATSPLSTREILYQKWLQIREKRIVKFANQIQCENCTGNYIKNSKNCINCFDVSDCEDMKDIIFATKCKDCKDCTLLGDGSQLCKNTLSTIGAYNSKHSFFTIDSSDIEYCEFSINSSNLFGCIGLKHKKYCIFNKQYEKEEYELLHDKIIAHMKKTGEYEKFFPAFLSCFNYNETTANTYYPLSKEEALKEGFKWK
jgi:hypothetical protein